MSWKIFLTAFASIGLTFIPENMIGCSDGPDPYDYHSSFFSKHLGDTKEYNPFYYTSMLEFYDDWDWNAKRDYSKDKVIEEWRNYCNVSIADAVQFVYNGNLEDVKKIVAASKGIAVNLSDSIRANGMVKCFLDKKNAAALSYIEFAKNTEAFSATPDWEHPAEKDSLAINKFINEAEARYKQTTDPFFKNKYAFQRCKLAFYNNRYDDCIKWYDEYFTETNSSAVNALALSYKAGSYFRQGKNNEAAYFFSKAFPITAYKKEVYLGFFWATGNANLETQSDVLSLCKTGRERANVSGMFALYGTDHRLNNIEQVYQLEPSSPMLVVLATREVNKFEELYLTPLLTKQRGGKALYWSWNESAEVEGEKEQLTKAISLFRKLGDDVALKDRVVFLSAAAYLLYMAEDYTTAKNLINKAKGLRPDAKTNDQLELIHLLVIANEKDKLDAAKEKELLQPVQWLTQKAAKDEEYKKFFRNFFTEIIAQKYEQAGEAHKATLAYAASDMAYSTGLEFVRNEMNTTQLLQLYELIESKNKTSFEQFLVAHSRVKRDDVIDVIGTSHLRDQNFAKAIEWLKKAKELEAAVQTRYNWQTDKTSTYNVDPFHDYLNDWNRFDKVVKTPYTKLSLAEECLRIQKSIDTAKNKENLAKLNYRLASAYYNMSHYGNCWMAVAYYRSGHAWNDGVYENDWDKEYFGVYKAKALYQKAYDLTNNKEFKAAALFMVAKCVQRQIDEPKYESGNYEAYDKKMQTFQVSFQNNLLFPKFIKEFGTTKFYKYTYNRCSYLRDFVAKQSKPAPKKVGK
jgi:hypothetical protein